MDEFEQCYQASQEKMAALKAERQQKAEATKQCRARLAAIRATQLSFFDVQSKQAPTGANAQEATPGEVKEWLTGFEKG